MSDSVRFVRFAGLDLSDWSDLPISAILKKRETDGPTDGRTDRPSYRDAWTYLKRREKREKERKEGKGKKKIRREK